MNQDNATWDWGGPVDPALFASGDVYMRSQQVWTGEGYQSQSFPWPRTVRGALAAINPNDIALNDPTWTGTTDRTVNMIVKAITMVAPDFRSLVATVQADQDFPKLDPALRQAIATALDNVTKRNQDYFDAQNAKYAGGFFTQFVKSPAFLAAVAMVGGALYYGAAAASTAVDIGSGLTVDAYGNIAGGGLFSSAGITPELQALIDGSMSAPAAAAATLAPAASSAATAAAAASTAMPTATQLATAATTAARLFSGQPAPAVRPGAQPGAGTQAPIGTITAGLGDIWPILVAVAAVLSLT